MPKAEHLKSAQKKCIHMMCCSSMIGRVYPQPLPASRCYLPKACLLRLQAGYYCSVCDCILRDSASYLDHINGKYHNRALGMSMRVERSTADQVG